MRSARPSISGMSCSMISTAQPSSVGDVAQQRAERFGLALGDAGGGLVEQQELRLGRHLRGQVADAPRARGELGDQRVGPRVSPRRR